MIRTCAIALIVLLVHTCGAFSRPWFVSTTGSDKNPGTIDSPFQTIPYALSSAAAGDTIFIRGGTYYPSTTITISTRQGADTAIRYCLFGYPGERPVLDFRNDTSDGISVSGSFYHLKNLEEMHAARYGINITGSSNIIENCSFHHNKNSGLQMGKSESKASNNLVLNCDSYMNYDPPTHGEDADGFAIKKMIGPGNVFKGCRSYSNSDDGFDLWMVIETITIDSCFAFRNGINVWGDTDFQGNGNGFKLGGKFVPSHQVIRNCVAFDNFGDSGKGFDENNNTGGQTVLRCTSYRNKGANFYFKNTVVSGQSHIVRNCISYKGIVAISSGLEEGNSWQGFSVSDSDFVSLDTSLAVRSRNADGSLPQTGLFRLKQLSKLVDAGVQDSLPFYGKAPDLGAFEVQEK
jgi:hypothetical protein